MNISTNLYTSQSYVAIGDRPEGDKQILMATAKLVISGSETDADYWNVCKLPANTEVIPSLSSLYCDDPGTALVLELGTNQYSASIDTSLDISAGGQFIFGSGAAGTEALSPKVYSGSYDMRATIVSSSTVTAGADVTFRVAYRAR